MKILCCSDIHMGRIPSVSYVEGLSSHTAWDAIVGKALELKVDVLVLAGDVVEQEDYWFEAYGPLLSGLQKLGHAGIQVIGVGGNHDYSVFPRLAKESPFIKVLGLGGAWEFLDYKGVRFVGWSFAQRHVSENPLDSFDSELTRTKLPLVGLLHCDVGSASRYAPVPSYAFSQTGIPWWVLGHIHRGGFIQGGNAFYCGSPYALDSNEEGGHGLWLLEVGDTILVKDPKFIPLCPYRFETCTVDLDGAESDEEVRMMLTQSLREFAMDLSFVGTLLVNLNLQGIIARSLDIPRILTAEHLTSLWLNVGDCTVHPLSSYADNTVLDINLEEAGQRKDAIALLANKLTDGRSLQQMALQYKQLDEESFNARPYQMLDRTKALKSDEEYLNLARQAAKRLLFAMVNSEQGGRV